MLKSALLFMLLASGCGVMTASQAQQFIYKWVDEQGQPKYSELPPPQGVQYETVRKPGGSAESAQPAVDLAKEQEELKKKLAEEEARAKEQQAQQVQAEKEAQDQRVKNCDIAKKNVELLQSERPVIRTDAQGKKIIIDPQQREAELQRAKKDQDYYCNP